MQEPEKGHWEVARIKVIDRWREILCRIDARDEGGVLGLANVIDEFCEEAIATRLAVLERNVPPEVGPFEFAPSRGPIGTRCLFCRGFQEAGGCLGMLASLNSFVLKGKWEEARKVAETYISRLEAMDLAAVPEPQVP